jgi:hypothetical protein
MAAAASGEDRLGSESRLEAAPTKKTAASIAGGGFFNVQKPETQPFFNS